MNWRCCWSLQPVESTTHVASCYLPIYLSSPARFAVVICTSGCTARPCGAGGTTTHRFFTRRKQSRSLEGGTRNSLLSILLLVIVIKLLMQDYRSTCCAMGLLDNDGVSVFVGAKYCMIMVSVHIQFLAALTRLFQQTRSSGSLYLTMKKCTLHLSYALLSLHFSRVLNFLIKITGEKSRTLATGVLLSHPSRKRTCAC